jgi:hypothetical protein
MTTWKGTVRLYEFENSTEFDEMNKPLQDLIERTDWLKSQVDQITAGENLIATYADMDETTAVGEAVYIDPNTGTVKQALAGFKNEYAQDGSLRLSDSGYVLGIVIEKLNATSGRVWINGTIEDQTLADATLGVSADPGIYRLSMTNNGELTPAEQELDILVIQYAGNGVMTLFDKRAAIPNHMHQTYILTETWLLESNSQFDEMVKPSGATYGYDLASDADIQRIFSGPASLVRIYGDGKLLLETEVLSNEDNIWWVDAVTVPTDYTDLEAVITTPYTFGEPILRGARTDTPDEITLSAEQGILTTNMKPWVEEVGPAQDTAVGSVNGRTATIVPVVSSVGVLGDLEKAEDGNGGVVISLGLGLNSFIEPKIVNLNNAIEVTDGYYVYYALPAGRDAKMLGRISIPYFQDANLEAAVVAEVQGLSGGGAIPALNVNYRTIEFSDTEKALPSSWEGAFTLPTPAITANNQLVVEADGGDRFNVTSKGTVFLELGFDTPSEDLKITRFGVVLYTI